MAAGAVTVDDLITRAHHTAICVRDFDAAREFYVTVLGFAVEREADHRTEPELAAVVGLESVDLRWAMLARDTYRVELFSYHHPHGNPTPGRQCDVGYTHMAFEVSSVDAAYQRLTAAGYRTTAAPQSLRGGRTRVVYVLAPETCVTELIEFRDPPRMGP